jgi:hypothetical protein
MDIAEVMQARKELQMAQQDFMLADTEFIDVAIHRLNAAEQRFNTLIKMVKNDGAAERRWSDSEGMGASQQRTAI